MDGQHQQGHPAPALPQHVPLRQITYQGLLRSLDSEAEALQKIHVRIQRQLQNLEIEEKLIMQMVQRELSHLSPEELAEHEQLQRQQQQQQEQAQQPQKQQPLQQQNHHPYDDCHQQQGPTQQQQQQQQEARTQLSPQQGVHQWQQLEHSPQAAAAAGEGNLINHTAEADVEVEEF
ncbi:hypothetical protein COO60DRAFT_1477264 [Scenedesmus sp. NREL 46B-D3]|nr:hypothetical protein COO60DRAFT_1477264 [Scenedesmus sp. NREL 46B-D3]